MSWLSIKEMVQDLGLQVDPSDETVIKNEIRKELSALHPDKNEGRFSSETARERFVALTKAVDYLDQLNSESQALIPVNQVHTLLLTIKDAIEVSSANNLDTTRNECVAVHKKEAKAKYRVPRLGSAIFGSLCGIIIAFAGQLKEHPLFSQILKFGFRQSSQYQYFLERSQELRPTETEEGLFTDALNSYMSQRLTLYLYFLLLLFICSGILFLLTWLSERKAEARGEWLMSERGLRYIFERVLRRNAGNEKTASQIQFSKRDLTLEIKTALKRKRRLPFQSEYAISTSLADKTAGYYIEKLERENIAKRIASPGFDRLYQTRAEVLLELQSETSD